MCLITFFPLKKKKKGGGIKYCFNNLHKVIRLSGVGILLEKNNSICRVMGTVMRAYGQQIFLVNLQHLFLLLFLKAAHAVSFTN